MASKKRRHHTVSQGLLRAWTADDKRAVLVTLEPPSKKLVGIRDCFVAPHRLAYRHRGLRNADMEDALADIESQYTPGMRRFAAGSAAADDEVAAKGMMILQWARSEGLYRMGDRVLVEVGEQALAEGEATEQDVSEYLAIMREANLECVRAVRRTYNYGAEQTGSFDLQRMTTRFPRFVSFAVSDSPTIVTDHLDRGRSDDPIAFNQATEMWMPLSPSVVAVAVSEVSPHVVVEPMTVQYYNRRAMKWSGGRLLVHPDHDVDKAFGRPKGYFKEL